MKPERERVEVIFLPSLSLLCSLFSLSSLTFPVFFGGSRWWTRALNPLMRRKGITLETSCLKARTRRLCSRRCLSHSHERSRLAAAAGPQSWPWHPGHPGTCWSAPPPISAEKICIISRATMTRTNHVSKGLAKSVVDCMCIAGIGHIFSSLRETEKWSISQDFLISA